MSTTWPLIKPLNSRPAYVMYVILWGQRNSTTTESQLEWWMLLCYLAGCLAAMLLSELPGRLPAAPWQLLCLSFACLSPVFRLCFAIGTLTPVFRYRSPHPPLPSRCLPMSAGFCRQNRAESGFCRDSAGRNPVHIFPPDSTGINPDSAGEERYFHMSAEFCPDSAGINCHEMWGR